MKRLTFLILSLLAWGVYAQDPTTEVTQETEGEAEQVEEETSKPPPTRLSGSIDRTKAPAGDREAMMLLAERLDEEHVEWMDTEFGPFMSVWYQDQSGDPKGALLIVHAEGESAHWPETTAPLHHLLPDSGWSTLAMTLPLPEIKAPPKRTLPAKVRRVSTKPDDTNNDAGDEDTEGDDEDKQATTGKTSNIVSTQKPADNLVTEQPGSITTRVKPLGPDPEDVSLARLKAAVNFLHDRGQFNIVIAGYGSGAIRANALIASLTPEVKNPQVVNAVEKPFRAFILINGNNYLPADQQRTKWFVDPEIPVLDVFINVHRRHRLAAKNRKIAAKRAKVLIYQSVGLPEIVALSEAENRLSRRIRSFLKKHAEGVEVDNARIRRYR